MTSTAEFHNQLMLQLDSVGSQTYSSLEQFEIDTWLNYAAIRVLKQRLFGTMPDNVGYDSKLKRVDDVQVLIRKVTLATAQLFNRYTAVLPIDYQFCLDVYCTVTRTADPYAGVQQREGALYATINYINDVSDNVTNVRYMRKPLYNIYDNKLLVVVDKRTTVNAIELSYITQLIKFNIALGTFTNLPEQLHIDIVNEAVLGIVESYANTTRVQTMPTQIVRQT
jgi:hypothetical protein